MHRPTVDTRDHGSATIVGPQFLAAATELRGAKLLSMSARLLVQVREIALALPEVNERVSHGAPCFFIRDRVALCYVFLDTDTDDDDDPPASSFRLDRPTARTIRAMVT